MKKKLSVYSFTHASYICDGLHRKKIVNILPPTRLQFLQSEFLTQLLCQSSQTENLLYTDSTSNCWKWKWMGRSPSLLLTSVRHIFLFVMLYCNCVAIWIWDIACRCFGTYETHLCYWLTVNNGLITTMLLTTMCFREQWCFNSKQWNLTLKNKTHLNCSVKKIK